MKYIILNILFLQTLLISSVFPNKPFTVIVPFGEGGSTDRMARTMKPFLEEELKQEVNVIDKKGQGTLLGTNEFLKSSQDGYNILASSFSPYIPNTILANNASYNIDDFEIINIQWFDYEFIAVNKNSPYFTILELLNDIKNSERHFKVAVLHQSTGYLIVKLLIQEFNIPKEKIEFVFFQGGKKARESLKNNTVDFIVISAQGSEKYREFIKPIAIIGDKRSNRWDAQTLNEGLKNKNIKLPIFKGSMRGFAVSKEFKTNYPLKYNYLLKSLKNILAKKRVQNRLKKSRIGYSWIGPEKSNQLLKESFELFKKYDYLRKD